MKEMKNNDSRRLYIFDSDGTLYDSEPTEKQLQKNSIDYIGGKLSISSHEVKSMLEKAKQKHSTTSVTLACIKEFGFDFEEFVSEAYLKIDLSGISVNTGILKYIQEPDVDKFVFTGGPMLYTQKILKRLSIDNYFKEIIGMKEIGFIDKSKQESFRFASVNFIGKNYDEIYFWDDRNNNRELGLSVGWIPMIP